MIKPYESVIQIIQFWINRAKDSKEQRFYEKQHTTVVDKLCVKKERNWGDEINDIFYYSRYIMVSPWECVSAPFTHMFFVRVFKEFSLKYSYVEQNSDEMYWKSFALAKALDQLYRGVCSQLTDWLSKSTSHIMFLDEENKQWLWAKKLYAIENQSLRNVTWEDLTAGFDITGCSLPIAMRISNWLYDKKFLAEVMNYCIRARKPFHLIPKRAEKLLKKKKHSNAAATSTLPAEHAEMDTLSVPKNALEKLDALLGPRGCRLQIASPAVDAPFGVENVGQPSKDYWPLLHHGQICLKNSYADYLKKLFFLESNRKNVGVTKEI